MTDKGEHQRVPEVLGFSSSHSMVGLPWWLSSKESSCNVGDLQEMWVRSLGQEDPLEKGMATHSSILARKILDRGAWWAIVHEVTKS